MANDEFFTFDCRVRSRAAFFHGSSSFLHNVEIKATALSSTRDPYDKRPKKLNTFEFVTCMDNFRVTGLVGNEEQMGSIEVERRQAHDCAFAGRIRLEGKGF